MSEALPSALRGGFSMKWVTRAAFWRIRSSPAELNIVVENAVQGEPHMDIFVKKSRIAFFLSSCLTLLSMCARAQEMPADYQEVLKSLDRKGDFKAGVLKVNIPRNDLKVTVQGFPTPTPFGFGG
jgi:Domain of Unknown Function (DUF1259)